MNTNTATEYRNLPIAVLTESATKLIVETVILLAARSQSDGGKTLRSAAQVYGVDTDAAALKVKHEFAAKEKARKAAKPEAQSAAKGKRAA
jgi:ParB family chromosome partitioning protein